MFKSAITLNSFIDSLSQQEREEFDAESHEMSMKKGQLVFSEKGIPFGCYFILEGKVMLYKTGVLGKRQIFQICKKEDCFGFHPVLNDSHYPDSAEILESSKLLFLPTQLLKKFLKENHQLCLTLLKTLSTEFERFIAQETMLSQKTVPERVSTVLYFLSSIYTEKGNSIIPLNRTELADLCGTVKETLVRILHELKDEGAIETIDSKGTISILNLNLLKKRGNIFESDY